MFTRCLVSEPVYEELFDLGVHCGRGRFDTLSKISAFRGSENLAQFKLGAASSF